MDLVLKQISRKRLLNPPDVDSVDALDRYFDGRTNLINRTRFAGMNQSAIREAIDAADQVTPPGTRKSLADRYDGARYQIWAKVEQYQQDRAASRVVNVTYVNNEGIIEMAKHTTVNASGGSIVNVAEYMNNVTNIVNNSLENSMASDDVKALIRELTDKIAAIADKADPAQTQKLGKNLEALSKEVAQPEPDREWYSVSLSGLRQAAEAVGDLAKPILGVVAKLMPLLLP